ncbi:MAG: hypothetical protein JXA33_18750 [Anaerolineae bacterium]|nr:hypothetical protein [Anaerolineae bacterium]
MITPILRALFLYHLAEYQSGNATSIKIDVQNHSFRISDDGRGHAIHRTINGLPYLKLVYSHLEYPFGLDTDTPIQLHTIGISLINSLCCELVVTVYEAEKAHTKHYKDGQLDKDETRENQENFTGTTVEGKIKPTLFSDEIDLQDLEQWLKGVKSVNKQLKLIYNGKEL